MKHSACVLFRSAAICLAALLWVCGVSGCRGPDVLFAPDDGGRMPGAAANGTAAPRGGHGVDPTLAEPHAMRLDTEHGPVGYLPQSSYARCLYNLWRAYLHRDEPAYARLFSSDYVFRFWEQDVSSDNPTPTAWGVADELLSARSLFSSHLVNAITLQFQYSDTVDSSDEYPGTWKVQVREVGLDLSLTGAGGRGYVLAVVTGSADIYFRRYPDEHATDGNPLWRIVAWKDLGAEGVPAHFPEAGGIVERCSWGRVKYLFY